jgi:hypothetical protein
LDSHAHQALAEADDIMLALVNIETGGLTSTGKKPGH